MKKILIAALLSVVASSSLSALSFGNIGQDIKNHTKMTLLESGQPSYFFDARKGINQAAFVSPLLSYRSASTIIGWAGGYDDKTVGTVLLGAQLNVTVFLHDSWPELFSALSAHLPDSVTKVTEKIRVGPAVGFNFSENHWVWGAIAGLELKFN